MYIYPLFREIMCVLKEILRYKLQSPIIAHGQRPCMNRSAVKI